MARRFLVSVTLCLFVIVTRANAAVATGGEAAILDGAKPLVIGHALTLISEVLDEQRDVLVYLPGDYGRNQQPLPVIYLLDGRANFAHTTATVDLLVVNARMPRSMVVGIANTDRSRDFTAVVTEDRSSGGADRFLDFFQSELIPFIEGNFRTAPHRTVIGHSLGGLFVLHALVERPDLFDAVVAISPAVTNDERVGDGALPISDRLGKVLADRESWPVSLFITMSDREDARWTTDLDSIRSVLRGAAPGDLRWTYREMHGEDHGTTVLGSVYHGLRFINADWDTSGLVAEGTLDDVTSRFEDLSARLGFEVRPPEVMVNLLGYRLLGQEQLDDAVEVFEYNVALYPNSANVYDSLGEALERSGKLPGAMRWYRKAVAQAEQTDDPLVEIFRANLRRVEERLAGGDPAPTPAFEPTFRESGGERWNSATGVE
ncbi:MAG: alpha/beta hydrolase-fold protein [Thermoanaerobaculales bacterium]|jgi:predicted alpha/beta superfamily hydrolase|nr:alpha/beta hydrolase-fold protein [Thermoanaerobaculales bacterium]